MVVTVLAFVHVTRSGMALDVDPLAPPPYAAPGDLLRPADPLPFPDGMAAPSSNPAEPIGLGDVIDGQPPVGSQSLICDPAIVWSSGTWLQRGFWYSEQDVVILVREFNKRNTLLARDASSNRTLQVRNRHPAAVANARITFGRFLFRDEKNRDHNVELTYFGAGREQQFGRVQSNVANQLATPSGQTLQTFPLLVIENNLSLGNPAFNGSNRQAYDYTSEFDTLEFNYVVKQRMRRDRMALQPTGQWVRQGSPTTTREVLVGLKWLTLEEWLNWDVTADAGSNGTAGFMRVRTDNDLVGFQAGGAIGQKSNRFSYNFRGKAGVYVNFARMNRDFEVRSVPAGGVATVINSDNMRAEEEDLSFVGEFQALARYHLNPNFSIRLGYELMFVDSVAVAPFQLNFTPEFNVIGLSAGNFYQGVSAGVEGYW